MPLIDAGLVLHIDNECGMFSNLLFQKRETMERLKQDWNTLISSWQKLNTTERVFAIGLTLFTVGSSTAITYFLIEFLISWLEN